MYVPTYLSGSRWFKVRMLCGGRHLYVHGRHIQVKVPKGECLPWLQVILLNFRQELSILAASRSESKGVEDCSDLMVNSDLTGKAFLGHNEDNSFDTVNTSYFVQATLVSDSSLPCFSKRIKRILDLLDRGSILEPKYACTSRAL